jgi:hypothetical protein
MDQPRADSPHPSQPGDGVTLNEMPWQPPRWCSVRKPPPLQSIVRLQRIAGNQAAQRILGIGDGYIPELTPATEVVVTRPQRHWLSMIFTWFKTWFKRRKEIS